MNQSRWPGVIVALLACPAAADIVGPFDTPGAPRDRSCYRVADGVACKLPSKKPGVCDRGSCWDPVELARSRICVDANDGVPCYRFQETEKGGACLSHRCVDPEELRLSQ